MKKNLMILIIIFMLTGCGNRIYSSGEVNVLNWSSYIPDDVIEDFENEYDIKVNYGTYSSNEELLAKVSSSKAGTYDIIFPSDYMVELMITRGMLERIDKGMVSNLKNIDSLFLNQEYDMGNRYSLPFLMATVVMAVNRQMVDLNFNSYNDLFDVSLKNNVVLLDDQRIVIGMSLQALGYSMNEVDASKLGEAKEWLLKLKDNIKAFDSDSPKTFLMTEEVLVGVMWSAEAYLAKRQNPSIEIIYPSDGYALSIDNFAIVKDAKNMENAYLFINYLLRDDVSARIVSEYPYISVNKSCSVMSYEELSSLLDNGSYVENIGSDIVLYDRLWAQIK